MEVRSCPQCKNMMVEIDIKGYAIDVCPQCQGMFFDMEELAVAKEQLDTKEHFDVYQSGDDRPDHPGNLYVCSRCVSPMKEYEYQYDSGIHIDQCPSCYGIFLNKDELLQINNYLDSEHSKEAQENIEKGEAISQSVDAQLVASELRAEKEVDDLDKSDDIFLWNNTIDALIRFFVK